MLRIRTMTDADVPLGMALKQQANWNQLEADWRRMLALEPDGCFLAEIDGVGVGTTVACTFGEVAWIAMVLVDERMRGQGVGKALMLHALEFLDQRGVRSTRLDATPLGQPLYAKLGFEVEYTLVRHAGELTAPNDAHGEPSVRIAPAPTWDDLIAFDTTINGTPRGKFLRLLFAEDPAAVRCVAENGRITGYLAVRPGCHALQLGPCLASPEAGPLLLADAWRRYAGQRVLLDVPEQHGEAMALARRMGLQPQRPLVRMCRGPSVGEDVQRLWASSGPELG
ncbi:MAG: GNAT family N-acetyltransferase [Planctomycetia bacterium]|nr:GNAT family N-acetyltransferase [Planctomycetia bacterium]